MIDLYIIKILSVDKDDIYVLTNIDTYMRKGTPFYTRIKTPPHLWTSEPTPSDYTYRIIGWMPVCQPISNF